MTHHNINAAQSFPLAIVKGLFNHAITDLLYQGARQRLTEYGFSEKKITVVDVPGAVEIPFTAQILAQTGHYKAIIALGAVIRGETDHYDYVCQQVSYGCQRVALDARIPVLFGVLTTHNQRQALDRAGGSHGNKGRDVVDAAVHMVSVVEQFPQSMCRN